MAEEDCPFCDPDPEQVLYDNEHLLALWDRYPVSPGHALLVPRRHVAGWFEASPAEQLALVAALPVVREKIERMHQPSGWNIGINVGRSAGQTVFHLHVHLIPRYDGDQEDPRGGVRHVVPEKARYWEDPE
ncbi:HIT family protein [Wenzhouxiangella sediminis]|uniref:HIT family protein n=1 Tax=Wenzhouxiangella sediminis TaxID=1792836 RepID=A0A3E1K630_9GAMM|nr:HIT family protein [Wenzhouxiangella sediminis]RFF29396.1 HIT family protein [Wenzhouxiangella sediminis]